MSCCAHSRNVSNKTFFLFPTAFSTEARGRKISFFFFLFYFLGGGGRGGAEHLPGVCDTSKRVIPGQEGSQHAEDAAGLL